MRALVRKVRELRRRWHAAWLRECEALAAPAF